MVVPTPPPRRRPHLRPVRDGPHHRHPAAVHRPARPLLAGRLQAQPDPPQPVQLRRGLHPGGHLLRGRQRPHHGREVRRGSPVGGRGTGPAWAGDQRSTAVYFFLYLFPPCSRARITSNTHGCRLLSWLRLRTAAQRGGRKGADVAAARHVTPQKRRGTETNISSFGTSVVLQHPPRFPPLSSCVPTGVGRSQEACRPTLGLLLSFTRTNSPIYQTPATHVRTYAPFESHLIDSYLRASFDVQRPRLGPPAVSFLFSFLFTFYRWCSGGVDVHGSCRQLQPPPKLKLGLI